MVVGSQRVRLAPIDRHATERSFSDSASSHRSASGVRCPEEENGVREQASPKSRSEEEETVEYANNEHDVEDLEE